MTLGDRPTQVTIAESNGTKSDDHEARCGRFVAKAQRLGHTDPI